MSEVIDLATRRKLSPAAQFGRVAPPRRRKNADVRSREYLTGEEIAKLLAAARATGRWGQRDHTLALIMFRHALRVSEAIALRWDQIDFTEGRLAVRRVKSGTPSTHYLRGPELRELRALRRAWPGSPYVFASERGAQMSARNVHRIIARLGEKAGLPACHPHQLRHSLGHYLANKGTDTRAIQDYMGHRNIRHTTLYTQLTPDRFRNFFDD
jgi:site-specific recombinase XerD